MSRGARRIVWPRQVDQFGDVDRPARLQPEDGQYEPLLARPERNPAACVEGGHRPEEPQVQSHLPIVSGPRR